MSDLVAGIDIGGTKCAAVLGRLTENKVELLSRRSFATEGPDETLSHLCEDLDAMLAEQLGPHLSSVGISCGGPLDSRRGLILSPPNLPGWDRIDVVTPFRERYGVAVGLQNDANAGALAEWHWGAGRGLENMIFLTFGTGMGAGLILNGRLYAGTNDMAGEVGHVRLADDGPMGYGKAGSFEGFCSGGGIARLAQVMALHHLQAGGETELAATLGDLEAITARTVGEAAQRGDALALQVYDRVGEQLGRGLAMLIDILNPQRIVIGSIYGRQQSLLEPIVLRVLAQEALPQALAVCEIVPAGLQENIGDYASLSVAANALRC